MGIGILLILLDIGTHGNLRSGANKKMQREFRLLLKCGDYRLPDACKDL